MRIIVTAQMIAMNAPIIARTARFFLRFSLCRSEWGILYPLLNEHDGEKEREEIEYGISEHYFCFAEICFFIVWFINTDGGDQEQAA